MPQFLKNFCVIAAIFCGVLSLSSTVTAQTPGGLDPNFGISGKVVTPVGGFNATILQPDGKIVAAGITGTAVTGQDFSVVRFTPSGEPDTTFDGDGYVSTDFDGGLDEPYDIALQPDGKIVVVGRSGTSITDDDAAIARYNPDGSLDTTFNGTGRRRFTFTVGNFYDSIRKVAILPDGKILISGHTYSFVTRHNFALARLNPDGSFDSTFGTNGVVVIEVNGGNSDDRDAIFALQPDGKIIVTGKSWVENSTSYALLRYNSNGTLDTTFGTGGRVVNGGGFELALQSNGKIVTAFCSQGCGNENTKLRRYNSDGSPDANFGTGGVVDFTIPNLGWNYISALAVQPDNKIILAGRAGRAEFSNPYDFAVARLTVNGEFDNTFGFNGRITTNMNQMSSGYETAEAVAVQSDGKIVVAGVTDYRGVLVRYIPAPLFSICRAVSDFDGDGKSDFALFRNNGSNANWNYISSQSGGATTTIPWGRFTDKIAPADFNGDCRTELTVFRDGAWWIFNTVDNTFRSIAFGQAGDIPIPADYDGDDIADVAVYRGGAWYIQRSRDGFIGVQFGLATDKPVAGDYDGDNKEDIAVFRDGTWYLSQTTAGFAVVQFGMAGDKPVVGDYDGDHKSDIAVFRPSNGMWYALRSTQGFIAVPLGSSADIPVPADYDGDRKTDFAVYNNGTWRVIQSLQGQLNFQFGTGSDIPISGAYVQ